MSANQQQLFEIMGEALTRLTNLVGDLGARVSELEDTNLDVLNIIKESLPVAMANGQISLIFVGMLLAELADGRSEAFDELMARTAAFTESESAKLDGPSRDLLLASLDQIVSAADDHFKVRD